jgi:hypothetical protein
LRVAEDEAAPVGVHLFHGVLGLAGGDLVEDDRADAFVGVDHCRWLVAPRDVRLDHVASLEGPVVGQGFGVLAGSQRGQFVELAAGDHGLFRDRLGRGQH